MNKGLKQYTKQLINTVGIAGDVSVNINKADANLIIKIPLLDTIGLAPIDLSLTFNLQDQNENGLFGKGVKLNYYKKFNVISSNVVSSKNYDGSTNEYTKQNLGNNQGINYICKETQDAVTYWVDNYSLRSGGFNIEDKYKNKADYEEDGYPKLMKLKSGDTYNFNFSTSTKTINNNKANYINVNTKFI